MARDKRKKKGKIDENENKHTKKSESKSFLKKRAPFYLAGIALIVAFVIPELMQGNLEKSLPDLAPEDQQVVDMLMGYNGPNESGLTVMDAIKNKIADEYPDEKIYDNKKTNVELTVSNIEAEKYQIVLNFESHKGEMNYDWNIDRSTGKITSNNPESKHIIELVDFYD